MRLEFAQLLILFVLLVQSAAAQSGRMVITSVDVTSDSSVSSDHLRAITEEVTKNTYTGNQPGEEIAERARYLLQQDGYFKAKVSLADQFVSSTQSTVAVTLGISEGQQYSLKEIDFSSNGVFRAQQLREQFEIGNGEIFDVEKIRRGLERLRRLYASRGYINFAPVPNTDADDENRVVTLRIDCDEGKQFHYGKLIVLGNELHLGDSERILKTWRFNEGDVYNGDEVEKFWTDIAPYLPPEWPLNQHLEIRQNVSTATADLTVLLPESELTAGQR
jgi:outer membrane protein insertion porin family